MKNYGVWQIPEYGCRLFQDLALDERGDPLLINAIPDKFRLAGQPQLREQFLGTHCRGDSISLEVTRGASVKQTSEIPQLTQWVSLLVFILICLGAGGLGAAVTTPEIDGWYRTIIKPSWNPPDRVFGPVWTTLYLMMAIAAWLVWKADGLKAGSAPLALFFVQLILNVGWSWIFFGLHQPGWAFAEIVVLGIAIAWTMIAFFRRSRLAGGLLIPYLAWVTFASVLNFTIWRLNLQ